MIPMLLPIFLLALAETPLADPLAPAAQGKVQCYSPDPARKTCKSWATYEPAAGGGYNNTAYVLVSTNPAIVMKITSPVVVRNDQVCGPIRSSDFDTAEFQVMGRAMPPAETSQARSQMRGAMAAMIGKEVCTAYLATKTANMMTARASYDGVPRPELDQTVAWVTLGEGFRVAP